MNETASPDLYAVLDAVAKAADLVGWDASLGTVWELVATELNARNNPHPHPPVPF